jgi:pimeloyl-ACP methyl ester carboxylesterase
VCGAATFVAVAQEPVGPKGDGGVPPLGNPADYDEFGLLHENAEEMGLSFENPPPVRRVFVDLEPGRRLSALVWGDSSPNLVLLHGGAQNAHTWDSVVLALGRPVVAIDLPGHGHSDGGRDQTMGIDPMADDVAIAMAVLAPDAGALAGMSLGGLTSILVADRHPELVRRHVLVDVTPGVTHEKSRAITDFISGPESFESFDEILERTVAFNPGRSVSSLRRGILHNAVQGDDGRWMWRWQRFRTGDGPATVPDFGALWDAIERGTVPMMLVRGMLGSSVVDDADEEELRRRRPDVRVEHVDNAGHSVQGDAPRELAALLADFVP